MVSAPRIGQVSPSTAPDASPIPPTYIPELSVDRLSGGTISGAVIEVGDDGVIKAGLGRTTVELVKEGLFGYIDNVEVFHLADGELFVKGTVQADDGYFAGALVGNAISGASIDGSTITGGTITIGSGDAVFRASQLGIQLGSGDWLTAPFTVDTTGRLTAHNATITGTIATADSGARTVIGQGLANSYPAGRIDMWSGLAGETIPASITQQRVVGSSYGNQLVVDAGKDPVLNIYGGKLVLRSEQDGTGLKYAVAAIFADQTSVSGELAVNHKFWELTAQGPAADQWNFDPNATPGTPGTGYARIWKEPTGAVFVQGSFKATQAWVNGTVISNITDPALKIYYHSRFIRGFVGGTTPVEIEVMPPADANPNTPATLVCRGGVPVNSRVEIFGFWPTVEAPLA